MPYGGYDLHDLIRNYDYNYKKKQTTRWNPKAHAYIAAIA